MREVVWIRTKHASIFTGKIAYANPPCYSCCASRPCLLIVYTAAADPVVHEEPTSPSKARKRCHPIRTKFGTSTVPLATSSSSAHLLRTLQAFLSSARDLPSWLDPEGVVVGCGRTFSQRALSRMVSSDIWPLLLHVMIVLLLSATYNP